MSASRCLLNPAYTSDFAPTDFHMFSHLDHFLRGKRFANQDAVIPAVSDFFNYYDAGFCHCGIFALKTRWAQYITTEGGYFVE